MAHVERKKNQGKEEIKSFNIEWNDGKRKSF